MRKAPKGYDLIFGGLFVEFGDLLWTTETQQWEPARGGEIGTPARAFWAVARKAQGGEE